IICAPVFSASGSFFVTGGYDHRLVVWEFPSCKPLLEVDTGGQIWGLSISPDEKSMVFRNIKRIRLAPGEMRSEYAVLVLDVKTGKGTLKLENLTSRTIGAVFSPDSKKLFLSHEDGTIEVLDLQTGKVLDSWSAGRSAYGLVFSPDGSTLATATWDLEIHLWDMTGPVPKHLRTLKGGVEQINHMAFSKDSKLIVAGYGGRMRGDAGGSRSEHGCVIVWETATGKRFVPPNYTPPKFIPLDD
ncbi:MAG: WD40 repeat domain-containing protein, partial [Gemmataceae bacterium]|nr:WD40 repeat domain-containing protein [Gemmataceae bacterium]